MNIFFLLLIGFASTANALINLSDEVINMVLENEVQLDEKHNRARRTVNYFDPNKPWPYLCTKEQFGSLTGTCAQLVYQSYRQAGNISTCSESFPKFVDCSVKIVTYCKKETDAWAVKNNLHQKLADNLQSTGVKIKKVMCDDGGSRRMADGNITRFCDAAFPNIYFRCVKPFHDVYDKNRGDPALCQANQDSNQCVFSAMDKYCNKTEMMLTMKMARTQLNRKANHFCFKSQGGGDPQQILTGDFDEYFAEIDGNNAASINSVLSFQLMTMIVGMVSALLLG